MSVFLNPMAVSRLVDSCGRLLLEVDLVVMGMHRATLRVDGQNVCVGFGRWYGSCLAAFIVPLPESNIPEKQKGHHRWR